MRSRLSILLVGSLFLFACAVIGPTPTPAAAPPAAAARPLPDATLPNTPGAPGIIYLTIVSHNEQPSNRRPDYLADTAFYHQNRVLLVQLVAMLVAHGAAYNFQSDWNFLRAVERYDTGAANADTAGVNILRWMVESQGVEVDPHAHETQYNYADVAYLIEQLGVTPTHTVGGFLYDPPDNPQGWEKHRRGLNGQKFPDYFWRAAILWGAATSLHQGSDDHTAGVWIPADREHFYRHDPDQALIYIGACSGDMAGVVALRDAIRGGQAPADGFYTAAIILAQDFLTAESLAELEAFLDRLEPDIQAGTIQWAHLSTIAASWRNDYQARPFQFTCAG